MDWAKSTHKNMYRIWIFSMNSRIILTHLWWGIKLLFISTRRCVSSIFSHKILEGIRVLLKNVMIEMNLVVEWDEAKQSCNHSNKRSKWLVKNQRLSTEIAPTMLTIGWISSINNNTPFNNMRHVVQTHGGWETGTKEWAILQAHIQHLAINWCGEGVLGKQIRNREDNKILHESIGLGSSTNMIITNWSDVSEEQIKSLTFLIQIGICNYSDINVALKHQRAGGDTNHSTTQIST